MNCRPAVSKQRVGQSSARREEQEQAAFHRLVPARTVLGSAQPFSKRQISPHGEPQRRQPTASPLLAMANRAVALTLALALLASYIAILIEYCNIP